MLSVPGLMLRPWGFSHRRIPQHTAYRTEQHMRQPCESSLRRQAIGRVEAWEALAPQVSPLRPGRAGLHSSPAVAKSRE